MEKRTARNWYWWLWLSPLVAVPSMGYSFLVWAFPAHQDRIAVGLIAALPSAVWHLVLLVPALNKKSEFVRWHGRQALLLAGMQTATLFVFGFLFSDFGLEPLHFILALILIAIWFFGTLWGQRQAIRGDCSLMRWFGQAEALEKKTARNWYWWLWLSPLIVVPSFAVLSGRELSVQLFCKGNWHNCNWNAVRWGSMVIAVLGSAFWHLVLLFPALNKRNKFVRWHGRQALLLAGMLTAVLLVLRLIAPYWWRWHRGWWFVPILIAWFFGTLWGQRQAARGDCSLMRWLGRAEALPRSEPTEEPTEYAELDPEALVEIVRHSRDPEERRQALAELEKQGTIGSL